MRYLVIGIKLLITVAFVVAGATKLIGLDMQIATFETLGLGQWFRYVTGLIEVGAAVLLWIPGRQAIGALLAVCTMAGAVVAHLTVLGPSAVPAFGLGILAAFVVFEHRDQLPGRG